MLFQRAIRRVGHEGDVTRSLQRYRPALLATGFGIGSHRLLHEVGQLGHLLRIGDVQRKGIGRLQGILSEEQGLCTQLLRVVTIECLILLRKGCTTTGKPLVGILQEFLLDIRQAPSGLLIDRLHTCKKFGVERDVVREFG